MARLAMLAALVVVLVVAAPAAEAGLSCGQVTGYISSCMPFAQGKAAAPSGQCCSGVRTLNSVAASTADRQMTCNCLKRAAGQINGINPRNAAGIPSRCGVAVPWAISTSTDCSKVH